MTQRKNRALTYLIVGFCVAAFIFWLGKTAVVVRDPNQEMAETAREAVQMAEDARRDAVSARKTSFALRAVALAVGTVAPLVVAYLIYRLRSKDEPELSEVLEVLWEAELDSLPPPERKSLPGSSSKKLESGESESGDEG